MFGLLSFLDVLIKPEILMHGLLLTSPCQGMANRTTGVQDSHHAKEKIPDLLSLLRYIHNWGHNILWQYTLIFMLDLSLLPLCCWLLQVAEHIYYPYYPFEAQLIYITRSTWRKVLTSPPFPAWQKGLDTVSPWRNPISCMATPEGRAAPLHWWQNSLPSCHSSIHGLFLIFLPVLQETASYQREKVLREDGWFIVQRALQTQS